MVKVYKQDMPRSYAYEKDGTYNVKISGNLKSASFAGNSNNGLTNALVEVCSLDKNIEVLSEYAFFACSRLRKVNLSSSNVREAKDFAFSGCAALSELTCNSSLHKIGSNCFDSCTSLTSLSFISYEQDLSDSLFEAADLSAVGNSAFANTQSLKCLAVPAAVQLKDSHMLENAPALQHIMLLGMSDENKDEMFEHILSTSMLGLSSNCTFEGIMPNEVYEYVHSQVPSSSYIRQLSSSSGQPMTTYFNLEPSDVPDNFDNMQPMSIYSYSAQHVQHCLDNGLDFIVLYIDSKTSAKSKQLLMMQDAGSLFFNQYSQNAMFFLLDRHDPSTGQIQSTAVSHYKQNILQNIANKQALIHATTDPLSIVDFPEVSLVSKNGIKYQKLSLVVNSYSTMKAQLENAAGNVFNKT